MNEISAAALRYGAALRFDEVTPLAARLYGFQRWPLSPKLVQSLPGQHDLRQFVIREGPPELTRHWRSRRYESLPGWLVWIRRERAFRERHLAYKLYLSPPPTLVRDALRELVPALTDSGCTRFKVAATPSYLARPDKLIAYFESRDAALQTGEVVRKRLDGLAVQGVPFTCAVDSAGLLSWGMDPPSNHEQVSSWRTWLCFELATAMVNGGGDGVAAARQRLAKLRIDADTWEPPPELWERHGPE